VFGVQPHLIDRLQKVSSFGVPSELELAHDYLWRNHRETPARGEIRSFNRSHYEDVLVVRVRNLVPKEVWERRYRHINDFERMLADEGTTIVKFYLHISKGEQSSTSRPSG
jgi:polyphosphate kinase 2 (PPK2 family)